MTDDGAAGTVAPDYAEARRRFQAAASEAGAELASIVDDDHRGRQGEELAIDVAALGPKDAPSVLFVVSGTHGVEGYGGSAVQTAWLAGGRREPNTRVVLVHALNPFGFSWSRRVDADNVDVNRNFCDEPTAPPAVGHGQGLGELLAPSSWTADDCLALLAAAAAPEWTPAPDDWELMRAVSRGQDGDPDGIAYRGRGPCWSARQLQPLLDEHLTGRQRVDVVDLHTGLGPRGSCTLIVHATAGSTAHRRAVDRHGGPLIALDQIPTDLSGTWPSAVVARLGEHVTAVTAELGTVGEQRLLPALRVDNWLHRATAAGTVADDDADAIRAGVRATFAGDDLWATTVAARGMDVLAACA